MSDEHEPEETPIDGDAFPEVEDIPEGYVPPGESREYERSGEDEDEAPHG